MSWKTLTELMHATDETENEAEVKELFEHDKIWQRSWCDMEDDHFEESSDGTLARGDDHSNYTHKQGVCWSNRCWCDMEDDHTEESSDDSLTFIQIEIYVQYVDEGKYLNKMLHNM